MQLGLAYQATRGEDARINREHRLARYLEFAWAGGHTSFLRSEAGGGEVLTPNGSTPLVDSIDGWGVRSTAADEAWIATLADSTRFAGNATLIWRGVLLGAPGATNNGSLVSIDYGNGTGSPYVVLTLARDQTSADSLVILRNNGSGTYISGVINVGLSGLYNRPLTIAISNVAGSSTVQVVVIDDHGGTLWTSVAMNSTSGNPCNTSASDRIVLGCQYGAGRHPNAITTAAAIWSHAEPGETLYSLAASLREVFAPSFPRIVGMPVASAPPPPPPPPPPGSVRTTRRDAIRGTAFGLIVQ